QCVPVDCRLQCSRERRRIEGDRGRTRRQPGSQEKIEEARMSPSDADSLKDTVEVSMRDVSQRGVPAEPPQSVCFEFGAASHVGLRRPNNEDHYAIVQRTRARKILMTNIEMGGLALPEDDAYAMIVADGMGGSQSGEVASELVLRIGWELAGAAPFWVMKYSPRLIEKIRERISNYGRQIQ